MFWSIVLVWLLIGIVVFMMIKLLNREGIERDDIWLIILFAIIGGVALLIFVLIFFFDDVEKMFRKVKK